MIEKMISNKLLGVNGEIGYVKPGDAVLAQVDGGYSHEFTTAQVHTFLSEEYGLEYKIPNPSKFAVFEDHLLYATDVPRFGKFAEKSRHCEICRMPFKFILESETILQLTELPGNMSSSC